MFTMSSCDMGGPKINSCMLILIMLPILLQVHGTLRWPLFCDISQPHEKIVAKNSKNVYFCSMDFKLV